ncbi:hypothetical protein F5Y16DRAFT_399286 [Xylariaceae sp. FL0255]|nr:hypothetical protein F5Y16DRAFT_399286 [Xylariaceae sp. FL0255]
MLSALLLVGLAAQAIAEPVRHPYQPSLARMSTREMLGLDRRTLEAGYSPGEQLCGVGQTCAEACGEGFEQCASKDSFTHCYDPTSRQICCPGGTGDSCDPGFYCSGDAKGATWCCPDSMSLTECASKFGTGPLTSDGGTSGTTSTTSTTHKSTTTKPSTTEPSTTKTEATTSTAKLTTKLTSSTTTKETKTAKLPQPGQDSTTISKAQTTDKAVSPGITTTSGATTTTVGGETTTIPHLTITAPVSTAPVSTAPSASSSILSGSGAHSPVQGIILLMAGILGVLV